MPMQTLSICNSHPPIHGKSLNQNLPWNPSIVTLSGFPKSLKTSTIFTLRTHPKMKNSRLTVFAVKGEEEQSTPSWAKPDSEEPPPWARNETQQPSSSSNSELPFFVYLLASAITAIAAIGSVFEYVNQRPVFGVLNSDSIFYTPVLGFFAITGLPTAILKMVQDCGEHTLPVTGVVVKKKVSRGEQLQRAQWLRAAILGANDGLLSTTSLMMGVGAAQEDQWFMILSGVAGAVAGACSMAVGEFVSVATQRDIELAVNQEHPSNENSNLQEIKLEIPKNDKNDKTIVQTYIPATPSPGRSPVVNVVMMDGRENTENDEKERLPNPLKAGAASALAFLCGSLFPLAAAIAVNGYTARIVAVVVVTSVALVLFGGIGAFIGGSCVRASAARVLFGGWISMAVTYSLLKPLDSVTDKKMNKDS